MGYTPFRYATSNDLSPQETPNERNLSMMCLALGKTRLCHSVVGLSGLEYELADNLPYGHQRRLEIARALANNPKFLLLDEPAAGMNPREVKDLMQLIRKIRDSGVTVLLIEHHMKVVMGI